MVLVVMLKLVLVVMLKLVLGSAVLYLNAALNLKQKCKELAKNSENDVKRIRYESEMILNNY